MAGITINNIDLSLCQSKDEGFRISFAEKVINRILNDNPRCVICFDTKKQPITEDQIYKTGRYLWSGNQRFMVHRIWIDGFESAIATASDNIISILPFFIKGQDGEMVEAIPFAIQECPGQY